MMMSTSAPTAVRAVELARTSPLNQPDLFKLLLALIHVGVLAASHRLPFVDDDVDGPV